jgi:hypothetical protein
MKLKYVYRVSFVDAIDGKTDYYFSSMTAIYTVFTPEQIGCKVNNLWNRGGVDFENPYRNKLCTITKERVHGGKHFVNDKENKRK